MDFILCMRRPGSIFLNYKSHGGNELFFPNVKKKSYGKIIAMRRRLLSQEI
jgi:hypothetical protein